MRAEMRGQKLTVLCTARLCSLPEVAAILQKEEAEGRLLSPQGRKVSTANSRIGRRISSSAGEMTITGYLTGLSGRASLFSSSITIPTVQGERRFT